MFNLKKIANSGCYSDNLLIRHEMNVLNIDVNDGVFALKIGDEIVNSENIDECLDCMKDGISELKRYLFELWKDLNNITLIILENKSYNSGNVANIIFLNAVNKIYFLSGKFSGLTKISENIYRLFNIDLAGINDDLVLKFNKKYLEIKLVHKIIMLEIYRTKLLQKYKNMVKTAQVSGPWANVDLPMKERVWEWQEDEGWFDDRSRARQNQTRYNPEYDSNGFYFIWRDFNNDPYSFNDVDESPYPHRNQLRIP